MGVERRRGGRDERLAKARFKNLRSFLGGGEIGEGSFFSGKEETTTLGNTLDWPVERRK